MKKIYLIILSVFIISSCSTKQGKLVSTTDELNKAIETAMPGDVITLKNGVWKDTEIFFKAKGTESQPITIKAETPGQVFIEGNSQLKFGGEYLVVDGLYFRNGRTPSNAVVEFRIDKDNLAFHCRLTNSVIEEFNQYQRDKQDHWIEFWGRHNQVDHCYIAGKSNNGPTVRVQLKGNESIYNYHKIINNHFGPRPRKGGPHAETIQIGDSGTSMTPSYVLVANNFFDRCNGEVEVISSKSNFNEYRNNVFYKSEGSLVLRHGNYCIIDGNYFIGDGTENVGGIRIINTGHWVTNNYFYNLKGRDFRSPLAVMNGIPKSPLNRYNQVTDIVVAYNTWVDCVSPWQFGVGQNLAQKEVLPASEIRSARPIRSLVANNIIFNHQGDPAPVIEHDKADGVKFKSNYINNNGEAFEERNGLYPFDFTMNKLNDFLYVPGDELASSKSFAGFEFEKIDNDLFGNSRGDQNMVGAVNSLSSSDPDVLNPQKYGPGWFKPQEPTKKGKTIEVSTAQDLQKVINAAEPGAIISMNPGEYEVTQSLAIMKNLTIKATNDQEKPVLKYIGEAGTPLFEMNPKGFLTISNLVLEGSMANYAFASLQEKMWSRYNLTIEGAEISEFAYVLKAYKQSYADEIILKNTTIADCSNGLELSQETNDKGDYNAEFLSVINCRFTNVDANVIDYYRGGYDESTIGGNLLVQNSAFENCGKNEPNRVLLNHRGIINVRLVGNEFVNNPVKFVSVLWGAKNNTEQNNTLKNSGEIRTEENIKLTLMY